MLITIIITVIVSYFFISYVIRSLKVGGYSDKYVFITGCDSGFGKELSLRLNKIGFHVISGCYSLKGRDNLLEQCPDKLSAILLDVTKPNSIQNAYKHVQSVLPPGRGLWAVVNNAGIFGNPSPIEMCTKADFIDCLEVNLFGGMEITKTFLPLVRQAKGRVVSVTSIAGRFAGMSFSTYSVSKYASEAFLDVLRREVYDQGVKVSIIEPGNFNTDFLVNETLNDKFEVSFNRSSEEIKAVYGPDNVKNNMTLVCDMLKNSSQDIDQVIDAFVNAVTAKFPLTRYVVGLDARYVFIPMTYLPDYITDFILHTVKLLSIKRKAYFS